MTKDEALKMCLEYIETDAHERKYVRHAIKKALAQPEPWEKFCDSNCVWTDHHPDCKLAQRTWVGLTDEEIKEIVGPYGDTPIKGYTRKLFDQIEAALRSKNT